MPGRGRAGTANGAAGLSRRQLLQSAGVIAGGAMLAPVWTGCGSDDASSTSTAASGSLETTKLKAGIIMFADTIPFWVAEQQGLFRDAGFDSVEGVEMVGGTAIQPAIQSGQLQLGWASVPSVIAAKAQNFDFRFFAGGSALGPDSYANQSMLVVEDSPLRSIRDLPGHKVGVNTLGNIAELEVRWSLDAAGLDPDSVELVELNAIGPDQLPPLIQGRIDALQVNEPTVTAALRDGGVRAISDWSFMDPDVVFVAGWVSTGEWLDANPNAARAFAGAMEAAAQWIEGHERAANRLISEKTGVPEDLVNAMVSSEIHIPVTEADLQPLAEACHRYGLSEAEVPAADIVWQPPAA